MKKESKICPLCNKACIIQYKNYKNIWKCTCGYEESLSNNTYVSSKGKYYEMIMCSEQQKENEQTVLK